MSNICIEHDKELKGPNKAGNYWHVINYEANVFCNVKPEELASKSKSDGQVPSDLLNGEVREKTAEPDWDEIAMGKIRHGLSVAYIESGTKILTQEIKEQINFWAEYIKSGK